MTPRDALLHKLRRLAVADASTPPVVGLDEYFMGNDEEDCIAPNQVGYGRPELKTFYKCLKAIEAREDVQLVLVGMHDEWVDALDEPGLWPAGDHVHIYTSATADDVEEWVVGLGADGAREGWPHRPHSEAPSPEPGVKVVTVYWD